MHFNLQQVVFKKSQVKYFWLFIFITKNTYPQFASVMMFIPNKRIDDKSMEAVEFNKTLVASLAFVVGIGSGIVGAAGGF